MFKLSVKLPPFSPDYSGVCSALFALGGLSVIHDAAGCTGNYTGYDEPRWYGSNSMIYCSNLRELDAVLGDDDKLVRKIARAAAELNPNFIAVLGSPVPMVVGTDFKGLATELEAETGLPCFGFGTTGLNYYDRGVSDALLAAAKRYVRPQEKIASSINLLGATPLDFSINGDVADMRDLFEAAGYKVIADFAMYSSLDDIKRSAAAEMNVVLSVSGLALAKWFEKEFAIPYVTGIPGGALPVIDTGREQLGQDSAKNVLIFHDQIVAGSIRAALEKDFNISGVHVASPFGFAAELASANDHNPKSEGEIAKLMNSYRVVIADPLFEDLIKADSTVKFIPLPHVAVSSRLYWADTPKLAGGNMIDFLKAYF